MKKILNFCSKNKTTLITLVIYSGIIILAASLSFGNITASKFIITKLNSLINHYRTPFMIWHIIIVVAIYFLWGRKVNTLAQQKCISQHQVVKIKRWRWVIIGIVLLIDVFVLQ